MFGYRSSDKTIIKTDEGLQEWKSWDYTEKWGSPGAFSQSERFRFITSYRNLILTKINGVHYIYRKSGIDSWERIEMRATNPVRPLRVGEILIVKPKAYAIPYVGSSVILSGTWTAQRSGGADSFIGGVEAFSLALNDTATTTFTPSSVNAQVGVVLRFGNNTGLCKVTINGGTELINLLPKNIDGDVVIDTYSATTIFKNHIPLASSLPDAPITIELTVLGEKNPLSLATRVNVNGFYAIVDGISDPLSPLTHAPLWATGTSVVTLEHCSWLGNEYSAVAGGTTGTIPPTHVTGTVSDGSVDWLWIRDSYSIDDQMVRQDTSESEYAGILRNPITGTLGEWGGDIHGNEIVNSVGIYLDGALQELSDGDVSKGSEIKFKQNITAVDSTDGDSPAFDIDMVHFFSPDGVYCNYVQTALKQVIVVGFFEWMQTFYHYDQLKRRFLFDTVYTPKSGSYLIANSYGDAEAQFGREKSIEMRASGTAFKPTGSVGFPSETGGTDNIYLTMYTEMDDMRLFKDSPAGAYVQPNPSGKIKPDGGDLEPNSGFFSKFYFSSIRDKDVILQIGDTLTGGGGWNISLFKNV